MPEGEWKLEDTLTLYLTKAKKQRILITIKKDRLVIRR